MQLIIVESPTKARTLQGFLGKDYKILSSFGHVRDLPKGAFGVDLENNFEPKYVIPTKAKKTITLLKKAAEGVDSVLLSTDPDREGEAIAWHLAQALKLKKPGSKSGAGLPYQRVAFHEITKSAIEEALQHPRPIDENLVNAQQARRILDRIVGYKLSPFLWHKIAKGLSAGRVQSVAVRLVSDREREIQAFKPDEYWEIEAKLKNTKNEPLEEFSAKLASVDGKTIDKLEIKNKDGADSIVKDLENAEYRVNKLEKKETKRNPYPPFTTSTLQQDASKRFHMAPKFTMSLAQQLFEMGLITYHRTDSLNLSDQSLAGARDHITAAYGASYWPGQFVKFKTKAKLAQEAHEAIRPTDAANTLETVRQKKSLNESQAKLYELIWQRFIASQMNPAIFDATSVDISAKGAAAQSFGFRVNGQTLKFDGFLKVYPMQVEQNRLPNLETSELLEFLSLESSQHFTKPPARYNEASLIKALEENGIGRPSTYASIMSTIEDRNYVEKDENKYLKPTEMGLLVNDMLVKHFPQIVDVGFTAKMEEDFDEIAEGKEDWVKVLRDFYGPFDQNLAAKDKEIENKSTVQELTDKTCPKCGANLVVKMGRFGKFYACPSYPTCKYTENIAKPNGGLKVEVKCPKCQVGNIIERRTKKRKIFYGCSSYPNCDFALWDEPTGTKCEKCGALMVKPIKGNEKCSNKDCETNKKSA